MTNLRQVPTASDRASRELLSRIDLGQFAPGDRLPPADELAGLLGVSRPVVLQALKQLEAQGRLTVRHGSGAWVSALHAGNEDARRAHVWRNRVEILEMCAVREMLEVALVRRMASGGLDPGRAETARELLGEMEGTDDLTVNRRLDVMFHDVLGSDPRVPSVDALLRHARAVVGATHEFLPWPARRKAVSDAEHCKLFEAVVRGDVVAAERIARTHIAPSTRMIQDLLGGDGRAVFAAVTR